MLEGDSERDGKDLAKGEEGGSRRASASIGWVEEAPETGRELEDEWETRYVSMPAGYLCGGTSAALRRRAVQPTEQSLPLVLRWFNGEKPMFFFG